VGVTKEGKANGGLKGTKDRILDGRQEALEEQENLSQFLKEAVEKRGGGKEEGGG